MAFSMAGAAIFSVLSSRAVDQRLTLTGLRPGEILAGRLLFLEALSLPIVAGSSVLMALVSHPSRPWTMGLAVEMVALVAVPFGLAVGALLPRELEATLVLIGVVGIQLSLDVTQGLSKVLPFYGPMRLLDVSLGGARSSHGLEHRGQEPQVGGPPGGRPPRWEAPQVGGPPGGRPLPQGVLRHAGCPGAHRGQVQLPAGLADVWVSTAGSEALGGSCRHLGQEPVYSGGPFRGSAFLRKRLASLSKRRIEPARGDEKTSSGGASPARHVPRRRPPRGRRPRRPRSPPPRSQR